MYIFWLIVAKNDDFENQIDLGFLRVISWSYSMNTPKVNTP